MSDISTPPTVELTAPSWEMLKQKFGELLRTGLWSAMTRPGHLFLHLLLLSIVGLTGWLSYEALYSMALAAGMADAAATVFPLQLDLAGVPAYQLAADRTRPPLQRWFGAALAMLTLIGSAYGNCVEHFHWAGWGPTLFISVISPVMCGATLVIWHLPRIQRGVRAVLRRSAPSKSATPDHPPESSSNETEVTDEEKPAGEGPHVVPTPLAEGVVVPEGPWTDSGAHSQRRFARLFFDLNGRDPSTDEIYTVFPPEARRARQASSAIRDARKAREREQRTAGVS